MDVEESSPTDARMDEGSPGQPNDRKRKNPDESTTSVAGEEVETTEEKKMKLADDGEVSQEGNSEEGKNQSPTRNLDGQDTVNPSVAELERKRTSLLQKLVSAPNIDASTTSVLQDVGNGLRYGRYAATHKPKPKTKSKGWQFHYNKETGGTDPPEEKKKKKKKREKQPRRSKKSGKKTSKSTTTTTTTTTSATTMVSLPPNSAGALPPMISTAPAGYPTSYSYSHYPVGPMPPSSAMSLPTQPYLPYPPSYPPSSSAYPTLYSPTYPTPSPYNMAPPPAASVSPFPLPPQYPSQPLPYAAITNLQPQPPMHTLLNEARLNFLNTAFSYIENYRHHLWVLSPLPLCVLEESTARYLLSTTKGGEEQSILALSFFICLCRGAMLAGDVGVCSEYFNKADQLAQHLESLSGVENYAFAAALLAMAQHGQYYQLDNEKNERYLKTAMRICVKMNALNSDVYLRCLYMIVFRPTAKISDVKNLNREIEKVKRMPYFALDLKTTLLNGGVVHSEEGLGGAFVDVPPPESTTVVGDVNSNSNNNLMEGENYYMAYSGEERLLDGRYRPQHDSHSNGGSISAPRFISLSNLNAINSVFVVIATVKRGLSLYRNEVGKADAEASGRLRDSLYGLLELTEKLETEVKMIQLTSLDRLPDAIVRFVKLFSLAMRAECKQLMRDYEEAVDWAVKFLVKTRKPTYRFAFEGAPRFVSYVLGVFLMTQQMEFFWEQISAIDNWIKLVPLVKSTVVSFTNRVKSVAPSQSPSNRTKKPRTTSKRKSPFLPSSNDDVATSNEKGGAGGKEKGSPSGIAEKASHDPSLRATTSSTTTPKKAPLAVWTSEVADASPLLGLPGGGDTLLQQLDAQKEKRRLLKEKIEVMQNIMAHVRQREKPGVQSPVVWT